MAGHSRAFVGGPHFLFGGTPDKNRIGRAVFLSSEGTKLRSYEWRWLGLAEGNYFRCLASGGSVRRSLFQFMDEGLHGGHELYGQRR
jgi:hypothetical protein